MRDATDEVDPEDVNDAAGEDEMDGDAEELNDAEAASETVVVSVAVALADGENEN